MELDDALRLARGGNALLFLGSGFSLGALDVKGQQVLSASSLAKRFCREAKEPVGLSLPVAAAQYEKSVTAVKFADEIKTRFSISRTTPDQDAILSLPWVRAYTTNYDNIPEFSTSSSARPFRPATLTNRPSPLDRSYRQCVHLNGYAPDCRAGSVNVDFRLTQASYLTSQFLESEWYRFFKNDMLFASTIIFVGYSMYDIDIGRIVFSESSLASKTHFIIREDASREEVLTLEPFGTVHNLGVAGLSARISDISGEVSPQRSDVRLFCFKNQTSPAEQRRPTDEDVLSLIVKGLVDQACMAYAASHPDASYEVKRDDVARVLDHIESGTRSICLHSDIGNGKSTFLDELAIGLFSRQFAVYRFVDSYAYIDEEITDILSIAGKKVFIVEDLFANRRVVEKLRARLDADAFIVTTIRTSAFELRGSDVTVALGADYLGLDLNPLSSDELARFVTLFDRYNLWGARAGDTNTEKIEHLRRRCRSQVRDIILDRFKNSYIHQRLENHFKKDNLSEDEFALISSAFMLSVLGINIKYSILGDAVLINPSRYGQLARSEKLREFISLDAGDLLVARSSVMADYVLRNIFDHGRLLDVMVEMCRKMSPSYHTSSDLRTALQRICRFAHLRGIFDGDVGRDAISTFYDRTRELPCFVREPQFWLQYAIARADQKHYDHAMELLDGAEAVSSKDYDTFKIDNTRARLLLERHLDGQGFDPVGDFLQSSEILRSQIDRDQFDEYPYRVARKYARYYQHFKKLGRADITEMVAREARIVLANIGGLNERSRVRRAVVECRTELEGIMPPDSEVGLTAG